MIVLTTMWKSKNGDGLGIKYTITVWSLRKVSCQCSYHLDHPVKRHNKLLKCAAGNDFAKFFCCDCQLTWDINTNCITKPWDTISLRIAVAHYTTVWSRATSIQIFIMNNVPSYFLHSENLFFEICVRMPWNLCISFLILLSKLEAQCFNLLALKEKAWSSANLAPGNAWDCNLCLAVFLHSSW